MSVTVHTNVYIAHLCIPKLESLARQQVQIICIEKNCFSKFLTLLCGNSRYYMRFPCNFFSWRNEIKLICFWKAESRRICSKGSIKGASLLDTPYFWLFGLVWVTLIYQEQRTETYFVISQCKTSDIKHRVTNLKCLSLHYEIMRFTFSTLHFVPHAYASKCHCCVSI